jgi:competence protein ComEC
VPQVAPLAPRRRLVFGLGAAITAALERRRLIVLVPFALIVGLLGYVLLPAEPSLVLLLTGLGLAAGLLVALRQRHGPWQAAVLLAALWCGFGLMPLHGALWGTEMLRRPAYGTYQFRVDEVLTAADGEMRALVSAITPVGEARAVPMRRARLVLGSETLKPGDLVEAAVRFYPVPGPAIPDGFDAQFQGYFDGVGAYGNNTSDLVVVAAGDESAPVRVTDGIRRGIAARIDAVLAQPSAGIARALITGDQSEVTDEARETMATAGLAHVLSVSGLHLTLAAALALVVLRYGLAPFAGLSARVPVKRVAAGGAVLISLGYFAISGGNVAALRSTIMIVLVLGAIILGRRALTMRNVALAALIVILSDPASVFRPSFQLSFAAVIALIAAWEVMPQSETPREGWIGKLGGYFGGIVITSLVAGLATLLFSIYHFQQTSPLGVVGNLFSLPLVGFVSMPAAMAATLLMPFGLEYWPLVVLGWSVDRMIDLATITAGWSEGLNASPLLTPVALGLGLAAFAWFAFIETWQRLIAPVLLVPLVLLLALDRPPDVLVADTTQALAVRGEAGLELVAGKPESFAVMIWRETWGDRLEAAPKESFGCDSLGCTGVSAAGFSWTVAKDAGAVFEDCGVVDLIVVRRPLEVPCAGSLIIDQRVLERRGVHWLRWRGADFEVRRAIGGEGRLWRIAYPAD